MFHCGGMREIERWAVHELIGANERGTVTLSLILLKLV